MATVLHPEVRKEVLAAYEEAWRKNPQASPEQLERYAKQLVRVHCLHDTIRILRRVAGIEPA